MFYTKHHTHYLAGPLLILTLTLSAARAEEPSAINPFGEKPAVREDAVPGYLELSDGSIHPGQIYLTRDKELQIEDQQLHRQRMVPLSAVKQIDCTVKKEWMEREWKFKETASDEKMYTGRSYPAREYEHTIALQDGRTISGGLSALVYLQPLEYMPGVARPDEPRLPEQRYILNKRNKGNIGEELKSLVYVKRVKLGKDAYEEGRKKAAARRTGS